MRKKEVKWAKYLPLPLPVSNSTRGWVTTCSHEHSSKCVNMYVQAAVPLLSSLRYAKNYNPKKNPWNIEAEFLVVSCKHCSEGKQTTLKWSARVLPTLAQGHGRSIPVIKWPCLGETVLCVVDNCSQSFSCQPPPDSLLTNSRVSQLFVFP